MHSSDNARFIRDAVIIMTAKVECLPLDQAYDKRSNATNAIIIFNVLVSQGLFRNTHVLLSFEAICIDINDISGQIN